MNKNSSPYYFLFTVFIFIVITVLLIQFIAPQNFWVCHNGQWIKQGSPVYPPPSTMCISNQAYTNPDETLNKFYSWYLGYPGNPLISGAYKDSSFLTNAFKTRLTQELNTTNATFNYDPILCSPLKPKSFASDPTIKDPSDSLAIIKITPNYPKRFLDDIKISLKKVNNRWLIDSIECIDTSSANSTSNF